MNKFSDRSSILLASTNGVLHEHTYYFKGGFAVTVWL